MKWKYISKKIVLFCLLGSLSMMNLTGCGSDTKIVFTTGLSGDQIFKIGSDACTTSELMIYLTSFYNQYIDIYGQEMWNYDFGGISLEEYVKNVVLSKTAQIKIMNLMAEERKITLSSEEEQRVQEAAKTYFSMLEEELKKHEKITESVVQNVYREYAIANKVYVTITEAADMEISDDDARAVTVQEIYLKKPEEARTVLDRIRAGEDFEALAKNCSEDKQIEKSYARGSIEKEFEELLFAMDEGDVSDVIEREDGYCLVKCISTMDDEATQKNKLVLAEQRKQAAFSEAYRSVETNIHSQFHDRRWKKITLDKELHNTEANFFTIYNEYIKQ